MSDTPARIPVLNAGSSSIQFTVFDEDPAEEIEGIADGIGGGSRLRLNAIETQTPFIDHRAALRAILDQHGISLSNLCATTNHNAATYHETPRMKKPKSIRRYGLPCASRAQTQPDLSGEKRAFHLGNGASFCAIRDGQSIATTMGRRSGSVDASQARKTRLHTNSSNLPEWVIPAQENRMIAQDARSMMEPA